MKESQNEGVPAKLETTKATPPLPANVAANTANGNAGARPPRKLLTCQTQRFFGWNICEDEQPLPESDVPYRTAQRSKRPIQRDVPDDVNVEDEFTVLAADGTRTTRRVSEVLADEAPPVGSVVVRSWILRLDDGSILYLENNAQPFECGRVYVEIREMAKDLWPERLAEPTLLPLLLRLHLLRLNTHERDADELRNFSDADRAYEVNLGAPEDGEEAGPPCSEDEIEPCSLSALVREICALDVSEVRAMELLARYGLVALQPETALDPLPASPPDGAAAATAMGDTTG